jgi:hypothetical protein
MAGETVECFNCGRPNPEWAQVCRSCGVPLRHGFASSVPEGRVPTDANSLISIGAVVATIAAAIVIGLFVSNLNPTDPSLIGVQPSSTATPTIEPFPSDSGSIVRAPSGAAATPTPVPTPALAGTIAFGTGIDPSGQITGATDTFTPTVNFAHVITMTEAFGVPQVGEQVVKVAEDGTETEVVAASGNSLPVDPASTSAGVVCCSAGELIGELGPGNFILRVYRGEELIAEGRFTFAEG